MDRLLVATSETQQMVNISQSLQNLVSSRGWTSGVVSLFCPHTSASIVLTEAHDSTVAQDVLRQMHRLLPPECGYLHHGNPDAHVKSALTGHSAQVFVENGMIMLGSWQGVFFCEFDGPRPREVWVRFSP